MFRMFIKRTSKKRLRHDRESTFSLFTKLQNEGLIIKAIKKEY